GHSGVSIIEIPRLSKWKGGCLVYLGKDNCMASRPAIRRRRYDKKTVRATRACARRGAQCGLSQRFRVLLLAIPMRTLENGRRSPRGGIHEKQLFLCVSGRRQPRQSGT